METTGSRDVTGASKFRLWKSTFPSQGADMGLLGHLKLGMNVVSSDVTPTIILLSNLLQSLKITWLTHYLGR
jgi:hypothetical protein